jgi:hypothetical protein
MKDLALFIEQLKNADNTVVTFKDGVLEIKCEKECTCEPEEVGTGVMEEFTESHYFEVNMESLKLTGISADN